MRASLGYWLTAGSVILLLALFGYAMKDAADRETAGVDAQSVLRNSPVTAKLAPDFRLGLFDGTSLHLANLKGHPILLDFWASWCMPCREEAAALEDLWQSYRDTELMFIGASVQDREAAALKFLAEFSITYPNGPDVDGKISIDYGLMGVPEKFLINRKGQIVRRLIGPVPTSVLSNALEALIRGDYE